MIIFNKLLLFIVTLTYLTAEKFGNYKVIFEWKTMEYEWPSEEIRDEYTTMRQYIPKHNVLGGMKIWKDKVYLSTPRLQVGVPVTLGTVDLPAVNDDADVITSPKIKAFPNWAMQKIGDCTAFQMVQNMEIDPLGRMWVLDSGRTDILTTTPSNNCSPRLVILDLEDDARILRNYIFPPDVAPTHSTYLNDIVLDHEDGGFAYISDSDMDVPGIIVYSLGENKSWKIQHNPTMDVQDEAIKFTVADTNVLTPITVDGIAMSEVDAIGDRWVYYAPLSSYHIYALPTAALKENRDDIALLIVDLGEKCTHNDGMTVTASGELIYGILTENAIGKVQADGPREHLFDSQVKIAADDKIMHWPDSFSYDNANYTNLYWISNSLQLVAIDDIDVHEVNYRVYRMPLGFTGYQYHRDGSAPDSPVIINH